MGIQVDKWTLSNTLNSDTKNTLQVNILYNNWLLSLLVKKSKKKMVSGIRGNIARLATVAYWPYPSFPIPSEIQRKYKCKGKPT